MLEVYMKVLSTLALTMAAALATPIANASDYGCRVLMCMSNPQGPMAVQQCQPPIQRFMQEQAKKPPDPFPSCEEGAPATMQGANRPYDFCPEGTTALGEQVEAIQLAPAVYAQMGGLSPWMQGGAMPEGLKIETGIGEGNATGLGARNKVCVGRPLGTLTFRSGSGEWVEMKTVNVFEQLTTMAPAASPRVIDVYIQDKLYRSVRY
jgi:hypothetical protein